MKRYEMTVEDLASLREACKPTPVMFLSGGTPMFDSQENANRKWKQLGEKYGFKWDSVRPSEEGDRVFFAEPIQRMEG